MEKSEFIPVATYLENLKTESKSAKITEIKNSQYYSLMPMLLKKYPNAYIRDYLEIDNTFAIAFKTPCNLGFIEVIDLYLDLETYLEAVTFMDVKNTGFIKEDMVPGFEGFWILIK